MWEREARAEAQWSAVSQATQMASRWRAERRRRRFAALRVRLGFSLVRAGLALATPLTVEGAVDPR